MRDRTTHIPNSFLELSKWNIETVRILDSASGCILLFIYPSRQWLVFWFRLPENEISVIESDWTPAHLGLKFYPLAAGLFSLFSHSSVISFFLVASTVSLISATVISSQDLKHPKALIFLGRLGLSSGMPNGLVGAFFAQETTTPSQAQKNSSCTSKNRPKLQNRISHTVLRVRKTTRSAVYIEDSGSNRKVF